MSHGDGVYVKGEKLEQLGKNIDLVHDAYDHPMTMRVHGQKGGAVNRDAA